jgi:hypothetical protein
MKKLIFFLLAVSFVWTKALAEEVYEEVSYDDLLNKIEAKKSSVARGSAMDPFASLQIHAGFGLTAAANRVNINGTNSFKYQSGFQLSAGIDLFTPHWVAEGALRNFGQIQSGTEVRTLREYDLKVLYRDLLDAKLGYRAGLGLGTRYMRISDEAWGTNFSSDTPTSLLFGGLDFYANKNLSFGLEGALRSAMVNSTIDRNAGDLTLRMDCYF